MTWQGTFTADGKRLAYADGAGLPWLPGRGNALAGPEPADVPAYLEARARTFLAENSAAFALDGFTLLRNAGRTRALGAPPTMWLVAFDVLVGGLRVEDAEVRFVVSHGNLVSILSDVPAAPPETVAARARAAGAFAPPLRIVLRGGRVIADARWSAGHLALRRDGERYEQVWEGIVRDGPDGEPFQVAVATATGAVLRETPLRVPAQAVGGVFLRSQEDPQTMVPLANLEVGNGADGAVTDAAGRYEVDGASGQLSGPYVRIADACGSSSVAAPSGSDLDFGASVAGDCTSPVAGAPGDTAAARTAMYHLNRIRDLYKALDPVTPWLDTAVDVIANYPFDCSNYYDAGADEIVLNWQASSTHCANAGHNPALLYHEWGHAYQWNQKGFFADGATREGYADITGYLQLPSSCPFAGFYLDQSVFGCTGGHPFDYAQLSPAVPARPDNIGDEPYACPLVTPGSGGVANYQGHCEAAILTQSLYDFALTLQQKYGFATGMQRLLEMWIAAGPLQGSGWRVVDPGPPIRGDGCDPRSWYSTLRVADDDNGNLLDGVPDEAALFDAFDRHGIACGDRADLPPDGATCPAFAAPVASLAYDAQADGVRLQWSPVDGATAYRVARSELGADGPFTPIATVAADEVEYFDPDGTARVLHWYVVRALGDGGCVSAIEAVLPSSSCVTATSLAAPLDAEVVGGDTVELSWTRVPNATAHDVMLGPAGALAPIGTTADERLPVATSRLEPGVPYEWRVTTHAADGSCTSEESQPRTFTVGGTASPPVVTSVTPDAASTVGGTEVHIGGAGFYWGATVWFGSTPAMMLAHGGPDELVVRAPEALPGPVEIRVENPGGGEARWSTFSYLVAEPGMALLENGAVEKLDGSGIRPPGWSRSGNVRPSLYCTTGASRYVHGGSCSVRFDGEALVNGKRARGNLTQTLAMAPEPRPPRLQLRFFARAKNVPATARVRVFVDLLAAGAVVERFAVRPDGGSYAFRAYEATLSPTVSYDAASVRILYKATSGRLWIDDVGLEFAE